MTATNTRSGYTTHAGHLVPARVRRRLAARLIDAGIIALCSVPVIAVGLFTLSARGYDSETQMESTAAYAMFAMLALLLIGYVAYEYRSLVRTGQTVGKRLVGIRVVSVSGDPLTAAFAAKRVAALTATVIVSAALGIADASIVTSVIAPVALSIAFEAAMLWRADGRHLADRAAASIVVSDDPELGARAFRLRRVAAALYLIAALGQGVADLAIDASGDVVASVDASRLAQFETDIATIYGAADALAAVDGFDLDRRNFEQYLDEAVAELGITDSIYRFDPDTNALAWDADLDTTFVRYLCFVGPLETECPTTLTA